MMTVMGIGMIKESSAPSLLSNLKPHFSNVVSVLSGLCFVYLQSIGAGTEQALLWKRLL
jgi:hypothetical protein